MASLSYKNALIPPSWPSKDADGTTHNSADETYIRTLVTTSQSPRLRKVEDGEIDIFGADKYFNGGVDKKRITTSVKSRTDSKAVITSLSNLNMEPPRTPSIHSESSSNSQSALLRRVHRNQSNSMLSHQGKRSSFLSTYCCDKKSVDIENQEQFSVYGKVSMENVNDRQITRTIKTSFDTAEITRLNKLRIDAVAAPVTVMKKVQVEDNEEEKTRRKKSLEVFGSDEGSKRFSLEKRLNMLSWDAIPRSVEEINTSARTSEAYKDNESDASSDLFEIECLSCTANPVKARNVSGETDTPDGYAPSEASIDWSVVTASAADSTVFTDLDDQQLTGLKSGSSAVKMVAKKGVQKTKGGGILAGCKSQKAVRVVEGVDRGTVKRKSGENPRMQRFSESYSPVTRFKAEAKLRQSKTSTNSDILYFF